MVRSPDTVLAAFDAGINFFFVTADMHWPLYEGLRQGLSRLFARRRGIRDEVVVAATAYVSQPEFCWMPFKEVLAAVPGLKRIDVTVAGGAYGHEIGTRLAVYREHLTTGHVGVRAIGTSFHDRSAAAESVRTASVDIAYIRYNPSHTGARRDVFPHVPDERRTLLYGFTSLNRVVGPSRCRELGLGSDHWYPSPVDYYRFALTPPEMDGLLCAPRTPRRGRVALPGARKRPARRGGGVVPRRPRGARRRPGRDHDDPERPTVRAVSAERAAFVPSGAFHLRTPLLPFETLAAFGAGARRGGRPRRPEAARGGARRPTGSCRGDGCGSSSSGPRSARRSSSPRPTSTTPCRRGSTTPTGSAASASSGRSSGTSRARRDARRRSGSSPGRRSDGSVPRRGSSWRDARPGIATPASTWTISSPSSTR